jgi:hypothetical protein
MASDKQRLASTIVCSKTKVTYVLFWSCGKFYTAELKLTLVEAFAG